MATKRVAAPEPAGVDEAVAQAVRHRVEEDWHSLVRLGGEPLAARSAAQRRALAPLVAGAHLQLAELEAARVAGKQALASGATRAELARALLPAVELSLARALAALGEPARAEAHLLNAAPQSAEADMSGWIEARMGRLAVETKKALAAQAAAGKGAAAPWQAPAWLVALADDCFAAPDVHDHTDRVLSDVLRVQDDLLQFRLLMSDRFKAAKDHATALHFLADAPALVSAAAPALTAEVVRRFAALGRVDTALDVALGQWLGSTAMPPLDAQLARQLGTQHRRERDQQQTQAQHGHHLLLGWMAAHADELRARSAARETPLALIEIGSTREAIRGQGSTRQLAEFCLAHGLHFVTVDMDPHNSRMARETFASMAAPFEAVTMKGEDYLRERAGPIDLVFLDAYDFDHGKHSALRQSRYEKYLGSPIDDRQCHLMHLDCAQTLVSKLAPDGVICFDDTWLEEGEWVAKGKLAMPYLLENGFALLGARNHAALLARKAPAA